MAIKNLLEEGQVKKYEQINSGDANPLLINENKTLFIDASRKCKKVTNNNKLEDDNIARIVSAFESLKNEDYFTHLADKEKIVAREQILRDEISAIIANIEVG